MSLSRPRRDWEEHDGAGGGVEPPTKRLRRCSSCYCHETKDFYEDQIEILKKEMECMSNGFIEERKILQKEMQEFYQNSQLQINELITEMRECYHNSQMIWEKMKRTGDHAQKNHNLRTSDRSEVRTYRMKFENRCSNDKHSRRDIKADDGNPIKVAIYDRDNRIVTHGPLSSMQVKIVVLDGEFNNDHKEKWNEDYFRGKIISGRTGKPPLFSEELYLRLEKGVGTLCGVKFQDNSSFVPSKKFKFGVMAADDSISEEIQEGISESFAVKDGRGFSTKKDLNPSLTDPVYKLKKIAKHGDRKKLLEYMGIKMVQDFLWSYNKDKNSLRKDCGNILDHDWDIIVGHALSCNPGDQKYSYYIQEKDVTILFNSLYSIIGAEFSGIYTSYEKFNRGQKDLVKKYRTTAYDNLEVVQHEDENACTEHELIYGDKNNCYMRGSCSRLPSPSPPTQFFDEPCHQEDVLESGPSQASPHPHQRWVNIVTKVTILLYWKLVAASEMSIWMKELSELLEVTPE